MQVGGCCCYLVEVHTCEELEQACSWAQARGVPALFLGDGSNVLFSDQGFPGLVLRNRILGIDRSGNEVRVAGGENLIELIRRLNRQQLAGMERMYGIPGTVAGAVVGNAGAYGQEISQSIVEVETWSENQLRVLTPAEAQFRYRHSAFKERREWFMLGCTFRLQSSVENLQQISEEILLKRLVKYPIGLKCPGSFFKNVIASELPAPVLERIPADFILFGKIPAGKLLQAVGANGARYGDAQIADYHGNLIINLGHATSEQILTLANEYAGRVWERFRIRLEPEIFVVDDHRRPFLQAHLQIT